MQSANINFIKINWLILTLIFSPISLLILLQRKWIDDFYNQMDRFNIISFIVLNKHYYIIQKSIILILNVYHKKVYFVIILKSKYLFAFIVILQPEKSRKIKILYLQSSLIIGNTLRQNLKISAIIIISQWILYN